jgi:hypothetical protein
VDGGGLSIAIGPFGVGTVDSTTVSLANVSTTNNSGASCSRGESLQFTCLLCVTSLRLSLALFSPASIAIFPAFGRGGGAAVLIGSESFVSHSTVSVNGFQAANNSAGASV